MLTNMDVKLRAEKAEEIIEENYELLANPHVINALGDYANVLWNLTNELYVPTYKDGAYTAPKDKQENGIPLVIVEPGEHFALDTRTINTMHPQQISTFRDYLSQVYDQELTPEFVNKYVDRVNRSSLRRDGKYDCHTPIDESWLAFATSGVGGLHLKLSKHTGIYKKRWVWTRPIVVGRLEQDYYGSAVFLHELVHVDQRLKMLPYYPGQHQGISWERREHEAHYLQALALTAIYGEDMAINETWRWLVTRDKIRQIKNKHAPDPYWAHEKD